VGGRIDLTLANHGEVQQNGRKLTFMGNNNVSDAACAALITGSGQWSYGGADTQTLFVRAFDDINLTTHTAENLYTTAAGSTTTVIRTGLTGTDYTGHLIACIATGTNVGDSLFYVFRRIASFDSVTGYATLSSAIAKAPAAGEFGVIAKPVIMAFDWRVYSNEVIQVFTDVPSNLQNTVRLLRNPIMPCVAGTYLATFDEYNRVSSSRDGAFLMFSGMINEFRRDVFIIQVCGVPTSPPPASGGTGHRRTWGHRRW
jgi:hypothetical protein